MTLQDFIIEGKREVNAYLNNCGITDISIRDIEIVKMNDSVLHALMIGKANEGEGMVGANVYVDDLFEKYESGCGLETVMNELKTRCRAAAGCALPPVPDHNSFSLENIRSRLTLRLLDVRNNRSYMRDRPYIDAGNGLVMVVQINAEETICSEWLITVNNMLLETIGCSKDKLLTAAMSNTIRLEPPVLMRLRDFVFEDEQINLLEFPPEEPEADGTAYLLTNRSRFKGAAVLFYPGVTGMIKDAVGGGYYVIPSSIHELIIIPDSMGLSVIAMAEMLRDGNASYVDKDEYLSDRVFHYDPEEGCLRIASNGIDLPAAGDRMTDTNSVQAVAEAWQPESSLYQGGMHRSQYRPAYA